MKREPARAFSRLDCLAKGTSICSIFYSGFWILTPQEEKGIAFLFEILVIGH
jgi:hypothetical protein